MTTPLMHNPQRMRIGLLGGTFDPIHIGHLILAEEAHFQLQLDFLYFVPAGDPPHKQDRDITPVHHRLEMLAQAIGDIDYARMSLVDVTRPGPHYASETVQLFTAQLGAPVELYFLLGMDSLRDLATWHNPRWLIDHCRLAAFSRPGVVVDWDELNATLSGIQERVTLVEMPLIEISSSDLRARISHGHPIRHRVPRVVEAYIAKEGLYRTDSGCVTGAVSGRVTPY